MYLHKLTISIKCILYCVVFFKYSRFNVLQATTLYSHFTENSSLQITIFIIFI